MSVPSSPLPPALTRPRLLRSQGTTERGAGDPLSPVPLSCRWAALLGRHGAKENSGSLAGPLQTLGRTPPVSRLGARGGSWAYLDLSPTVVTGSAILSFLAVWRVLVGRSGGKSGETGDGRGVTDRRACPGRHSRGTSDGTKAGLPKHDVEGSQIRAHS